MTSSSKVTSLEDTANMAPSGPDFVLIGGTGDVGHRLTRLLLEHTNSSITIVSRSGNKDTNQNSARVTYTALDVKGPNVADALPHKAVVINLTEATPPEFAAQIVQRGGSFLDSSATPDYVSSLAQAIGAADGTGTGVLCVGTAPGLSTLMAADLAATNGVVGMEIGLELGMGRHYGPAATEWFFRALGEAYAVRNNDRIETVRPGQVHRRFVFGQHEPARQALGIGFPGQGIFGSSLPSQGQAVQTFLAVDPPYVTRSLGMLLGLGLGPWMAQRARGLTRLMMRLPGLGASRTRIVAAAQMANEQPSSSHHFTGGDQAELTAAMLLITASSIDGTLSGKNGLTTISDHLTLGKALAQLHVILPDMEIKFWTTST
ncbi:hypothetical protein [Maritalea sp.]|jgi:hypothetical protein|uniref:hypothetical protein n=1 Tax=Maritalea sp. TaxID=2003361 RepID=UPI0039E2327B